MHTRGKRRHSRADRLTIGIDCLLMALLLAAIGYPLLYVFLASFSGAAGTLSISPWPARWSLAGYKAIFEYRWIWIGYANSLLYMLLGTLIALCVTVLCAYPLAQPEMRGKKVIMGLCVFTMYFGGGLIPTYLVMRQLSLLDTIWVLMLPGALSVYNMIVMRTYFASQIPGDMKEAAQLDGCGESMYLVRVVLPLSGPILAVIALYYAVGRWNSFFDALIYMETKTRFPLTIFLREILILNTASDLLGSIDPAMVTELQARQNVMKYALIIVSSAPMIALYPLVQKHFVKGVMIGAIKG